MTDADALGELYREKAIVVPRQKIHTQFADEVARAIRTAQEFVALGHRGWAFATEADGRALAEAHSWARTGEAWCKILEGARAQKEVAC